VATPVERDGAEAVVCEEQHLPVPRVGAQRPSVRERDGGAFAPVLVMDLESVVLMVLMNLLLADEESTRGTVAHRTRRP
jgi:hypothetical protein